MWWAKVMLLTDFRCNLHTMKTTDLQPASRARPCCTTHNKNTDVLDMLSPSMAAAWSSRTEWMCIRSASGLATLSAPLRTIWRTNSIIPSKIPIFVELIVLHNSEFFCDSSDFELTWFYCTGIVCCLAQYFYRWCVRYKTVVELSIICGLIPQTLCKLFIIVCLLGDNSPFLFHTT